MRCRLVCLTTNAWRLPAIFLRTRKIILCATWTGFDDIQCVNTLGGIGLHEPQSLELENVHEQLRGTRVQTDVTHTWHARVIDPVSGQIIPMPYVPKPSCRHPDHLLTVVGKGLFGWRWVNVQDVRYEKRGKICPR